MSDPQTSYPPMPNRPPAGMGPTPAASALGPAPNAPSYPGLGRVLAGAAIAIFAWQVLGYVIQATLARGSDYATLIALTVVGDVVRGIVAVGGIALAAQRWRFVPIASCLIAIAICLPFLENASASLIGVPGLAVFNSVTAGLYLVAWMVARGMPGLSYVALFPTLLLTLLLWIVYYSLPAAGLIGVAINPIICLIVVGSAWLGHLLAAKASGSPARPTAGSPTSFGAYPATSTGSGPTNALAIASIISVFFTTTGGLILGHMALADIRKTGEPGRGLALAAVIIGWTSTALAVIVIVVYFGALASLLRRY